MNCAIALGFSFLLFHYALGETTLSGTTAMELSSANSSESFAETTQSMLKTEDLTPRRSSQLQSDPIQSQSSTKTEFAELVTTIIPQTVMTSDTYSSNLKNENGSLIDDSSRHLTSYFSTDSSSKSTTKIYDYVTHNHVDYETYTPTPEPENITVTGVMGSSLNDQGIEETTTNDSESLDNETHIYTTLPTSINSAAKDNLPEETNITFRSFLFSEERENVNGYEVTKFEQVTKVPDIFQLDVGMKNNSFLKLPLSSSESRFENATAVPETTDSAIKGTQNTNLADNQDSAYVNSNASQILQESLADKTTVETNNYFYFTSTENTSNLFKIMTNKIVRDEGHSQTVSLTTERTTYNLNTDIQTEANNDAPDEITEITKSFVREERKFGVNNGGLNDIPEVFDTRDFTLYNSNQSNDVTTPYNPLKFTTTSTTPTHHGTSPDSEKIIFSSSMSTPLISVEDKTPSVISEVTPTVRIKIPTFTYDHKPKKKPNASSTEWMTLLTSLKSAFNLSDEAIASFTKPTVGWLDVTQEQIFNNTTVPIMKTSTSYSSKEIGHVTKNELLYCYVIGGSLGIMLFAMLAFTSIYFIRRNRGDSIDISEIPHLNLQLDDYRLAPIPRISTTSNLKSGDPILSNHYLIDNQSEFFPPKPQNYKPNPFFTKSS